MAKPGNLIIYFRALVAMALLSNFLYGCAASTKVIRNEGVEIADYGELYFIPPKEDSREVVPRAIKEFQDMGLNVRVVDPEKPIEGVQGTGFLISENGHVVTCAHVLGEDDKATIWIMGARYLADVVSIDMDLDLALLKVRGGESLRISPGKLEEFGQI